MMILRPSHIDAWLSCGRKFYYQYVLGLVSLTGAANLYFGTSLHLGIEIYLRTGDIVKAKEVFSEKWCELTTGNIVEYPQHFDRGTLLDTGVALLDSFANWWDGSGFSIAKLKSGELAIERRLSVRVSNSIILSGTPDVIAIKNQLMGPLDWKSVRTQHSEIYSELSDQLTAYRLLLSSNRHLLEKPLTPIGFQSFIDLQKKKVPEPLKNKPGQFAKNAVFPSVFPPIVSISDRSGLIAEYIEKVQWVGSNITNGVYFRESGKAFNTPCNGCDYAKHCSTGCDEKLITSKYNSFKLDSPVRNYEEIPAIAL